VADRHPDHDLLAELEPVAERLLERHLSMAKEWLPHEYIPWSLGRDFDTEPWTPDQPRLTGVAQAAFEVNLLTEDNLPSYHHQLLASFGRDRAWRTWSHRWTAEEGRHAIVLRDYLLVTRNIDPVALERGRMATLQQGWTPDKPALGLMAYAAFQELATRISHRNTGRYSDDPVANKIMVRVAADRCHPVKRQCADRDQPAEAAGSRQQSNPAVGRCTPGWHASQACAARAGLC
jgi:acyl-[acyl-carrier-protein] desaturase